MNKDSQINDNYKDSNSLSTEVGDTELFNVWADEYGALYSKDKERLLKVPEEIEEYTILTGTKIICNNAFRGCVKMKSVIISDSVMEIGRFAFASCNSLTSVVIPNHTKSIGDGGFANCTSLQKIHLSDSVQRIGGCAFIGCKSMICIVLPNNIKMIEDGLLYGCASLRFAMIPQKVEKIGHFAFGGCENLTSVLLSEKLIHIKESAFHGCVKLTSISIPDTVKEIEEFAFKNCFLEKLNIGRGVVTVAKSAFEECCVISLSLNCKYIDTWFNDKLSIQNLHIGENVEMIVDYAFAGCSGLISLHIPANVTTIGKEAFANCRNLKDVDFCNCHVSIGEGAFSGCTEITYIYIPQGSRNYFEKMLSGLKTKLIEKCEESELPF